MTVIRMILNFALFHVRMSGDGGDGGVCGWVCGCACKVYECTMAANLVHVHVQYVTVGFVNLRLQMSTCTCTCIYAQIHVLATRYKVYLVLTGV